MSRPEDSRVKIPALVHLTRLGYTYLSLKDQISGTDYDSDTNIFYALFRESISRINNIDLSLDEVKKIINELKIKLSNDDLGKAFFQLLKGTMESGLWITRTLIWEIRLQLQMRLPCIQF